MANKITWTNERRKLSDLIPWDRNPRKIEDKQAKRLIESFEDFGQVETIALSPDNEIYNGHQRASVLAGQHGMNYEVDVRVASRPLTEKEREKLTIFLHHSAAGEWDFSALAAWDTNDLLSWDFDLSGFDVDVAPEPGAGKDTEPQIDKAEELRVKWNVSTGQLWQLGEHRIICGDCTDRAVVERVMGGERAVLCHADPPYGMGKEKDGIANDNLYKIKLDEFQMDWWDACRPSMADNASAYIWGQAEDLWRLWYRNLQISERLTFRNEIVWDKANASGLYDGNGIGSGIARQYANISERCLFFMLGEQGFNNNADNYWDGWEPIRAYLKEQKDLMGWDNKVVADMFGFHPRMASHWFDESQWSFIQDAQYKKLQAAAKGEAFQRDYDELKRDYDELKRDYDELKRDFYATRAYFDNTHDNMTDVWSFPRVTGEERQEHATPKPVSMMERAIKSSSPDGAIVYSPFLGSGTDLIACENLSRKCRAIEISPAYVAVALQRWSDHTGQEPVLIE